MHVLVNAEVQLDRRIARSGCHPDDRFGLGVRRDPQLAKLLDPIAAAGLLDVGLATTFRLHGEGVGPEPAGGDTGGILVIAFDHRFFQRLARDQTLSLGRMQNNLREGDRTIGDESDGKRRILPGFIALQRVGQFDAQDTSEDLNHCLTSCGFHRDGVSLDRRTQLAAYTPKRLVDRANRFERPVASFTLREPDQKNNQLIVFCFYPLFQQGARRVCRRS